MATVEYVPSMGCHWNQQVKLKTPHKDASLPVHYSKTNYLFVPGTLGTILHKQTEPHFLGTLHGRSLLKVVPEEFC